MADPDLHAMIDDTVGEIACSAVHRLEDGFETAVGWILYDENTGWGWKFLDDDEFALFRFNDPSYLNPEFAIEELELHEGE